MKQQLAGDSERKTKIIISLGLGFMGFLLNMAAIRFIDGSDFKCIHILGLVFPLIAALSWGWRYGLLAALTGGCQSLWFQWPQYGWGLLYMVPIHFLWIVWQGWWADKRRSLSQSKKNYWLLSSYSIELPFRIVAALGIFLLFPLALKHNPAFWSFGVTWISVETQWLLLASIRHMISAYLLLILANIVLLNPKVRMFMLLEPREGFVDVIKSYSIALGTGLALWLLDIFADYIKYYPEKSLVMVALVDKHPVEMAIRVIFFLGSIAGAFFIIRLLSKKNALSQAYNLQNHILEATRDINRLITRESDLGKLLQESCSILIKTQAFTTAWIARIENDELVLPIYSGGYEYPAALEAIVADWNNKKTGMDKWPQCAKKALDAKGSVYIEDIEQECGSCSIFTEADNRFGYTKKLEYRGTLFGLICVTLPEDLKQDSVYEELFNEIAQDISYALWTIESEKKWQYIAKEYEAVLSTAKDAIIALDAKGNITLCNPGAVQLLEASREQILKKHITEFIPIDLQGERFKLLFDWISTHKAVVRETQIVTSTGKIVPVELSVQIWLKSDQNTASWGDAQGEINNSKAGDENRVEAFRGKIEGISLFIRDISERKNAEKALMDSEQRYRAIFDYAPLAYQSLSPTGHILDVNPAWEKLLGYDQVQILGCYFGMFLNPGQLEDFKKEFHQFLLQGSVHGKEYEIICKNGEKKNIAVEGQVSYDQKGNVEKTYCVLQDISELKRIQKAMEKRIVALTQPIPATNETEFEDLFNIEEIQKLQDDFASAFGVASIITNPDGTPITQPSNFTFFCEHIIRNTKKGLVRCIASDKEIGKYNISGPTIRTCSSAGLMDAGAAITVGGKHIANWLIGQSRDPLKSEESLLAYGKEIGADSEALLAAYKEIPHIPMGQFRKIARVIYTMAELLSTKAYQNIQQARFIAEREHAEKEKLQALRLFQAAMDYGQVGMVIIDARGNTSYINRIAVELSGKTEQELMIRAGSYVKTWNLRKADGSVLNEDQLPSVITLNTGKAINTELMLKKDGMDIIILCNTAPMYDEHNEITGVIVAFMDITQFKRAEEGRKLLTSAIEQAAETVVITDPAGTIEYVNPAFSRITGYSRDEVIGKNPRILKSGKQDAAFYKNMWKTLSDGHTWNGRILNKKRDGSLYTEDAVISPVKDSSGNIVNYVGVKRDITEDLRKEEQLQQVQKLESVGRLAGGVAHDFNNLLMGIMGYVDLCKNLISKQDTAYQYLEEISAISRKSSDLTRQLLTFAKQQKIEPRVIDINTAISNMLGLLQRIIGENIDLHWAPQKGVGSILIDPTQFDQILANIIVNARDAISGVGTITITTNHEKSVKPRDSETCDGFAMGDCDVQTIDYLVLTIADTGSGIPENQIDRIFDPFYSTKHESKGTGLGLSTVHGIMEQNNGFITVQSAVNAGTQFKLYFPTVEPQDRVIYPAVQQASGLEGSETILLVEDDLSIRFTVTKLLQSMGYQVLGATDPLDALSQIETFDGHIDLLVTDIIMPEMSGWELAEKVSSLLPDITCLFMSGYAPDVFSKEFPHEKPIHLLQKPFSRDQLAEEIRLVLANQST